MLFLSLGLLEPEKEPSAKELSKSSDTSICLQVRVSYLIWAIFLKDQGEVVKTVRKFSTKVNR